ncbi:MAG: UvrD-helicase domain-containing protein [Clostridiales Family XIII bacterium]|nr:UvrD-helicase domain-containing protein [Clostridia bacterium]MDE8731948.1 UvrD-helicase domain-containing protein [Eubacteriales bacterium DFI.9.88]MDY3013191.1 UvrD-helicase domain-containing protein [Clostridiales Family XIII bacterium]
MDYLDNLNPQQREAALYTEGPLLILAGAGSGKTSTMTHRIAYLIEEKGVNPYHILAVTFTNKAAQEMRDRVESLIGSGVNMWILTFHSACLRVLRKHAQLLGYKKDFVVYDPTDQKAAMKNIVKEMNLDDKRYTPAYFLSIISDCKEKELDPKQYLATYGEDPKTKIVYQAYRSYETLLKKNNAMDFDDLLLNAVRVFKQDEAALLEYQNRFQYIMVDEYQDTNFIQYTFIKMLAEKHKNLCVVGDDDQCIYQWRGADIRNILEFEKDFPNAKVVKLEQNYRSTANILAAAHSVIEKNRGRKEKKLWTSKADGQKIAYYRADDERDEAHYVAQQIDHLKSKDLHYSDFAILYRTNAQSRTFEEALSRRDIPYRVLGGLRYYDRKEVKDIVSYMRLVQNPDDDLALLRIINEPKRGIGARTVDKLQALARVRGESLFDTLMDEEVVSGLSAKASAGIRSMVEVIQQYSKEQSNLRVSDIYDGLLVGTGYLKALEEQNNLESESRIENLMEFKSVIYDYEKDDEQLSLPDFMERIALLAEVDNHDESENAVVLMTMHSAKGLEFPFVFLPGLEDGLFPGWRAFEKEDGLEEERRLCYVGMTRARERLFLTSASMRTLYGKTDYTRESQFLREMDKHLIDGDAIFEKKKEARNSRSLDGYSRETPFNPFDQLKYVKQQVRQRAASGETFQVGDDVTHPKFGRGTVLKASDKIIEVSFRDGSVKKLAAGIAPLTRYIPKNER